jgi:hypothetical protein
MWQVKSVARPHRKHAWLVAIALIPAMALGLSACNSNPAPPKPQVISDKGTPYGDLLAHSPLVVRDCNNLCFHSSHSFNSVVSITAGMIRCSGDAATVCRGHGVSV